MAALTSSRISCFTGRLAGKDRSLLTCHFFSSLTVRQASKENRNNMGFPVFPSISLMAKQPKVIAEEGYYPEAFINMLALLGWNPGTEQEIFSMDELIDAFSIER